MVRFLRQMAACRKEGMARLVISYAADWANPVENHIRPIALGRKNALFAGHDEGAKSWATIASLIETCKLNGIEPFAWLKGTLEAIAAGHSASPIDELLPWNAVDLPTTE